MFDYQTKVNFKQTTNYRKNLIEYSEFKENTLEVKRMGNFQTINTQQFQEGTNNQLGISVDFKRPVLLQLKPLLYWSLKQIRNIYAPFRQRKGSPLLSRSEFLRFLRLSRIMSFNLFDRMCSKNSMNVFEILSVLVLTSYTSYTYKIHFLFNVFDLDSSRGLQFKELILSFKSLIRGYCILTNQPIPDNDLLQKYGQVMFSRADLNNDQCLQLGEVLSWFQGNVEGLYLFKRFQPTDVIGKEDYLIFSSFTHYTDAQIKLLYYRIQKEYKKIPLTEDDFQLLTCSKDIVIKKTSSRDYTETIRKSERTGSKSSLRPKMNTFEETSNQKKVGFNVLIARVSQEKNSRFFPKFSREASIFEEDFGSNSSTKQNFLKGSQSNMLKTLSKTSMLNSSHRVVNQSSLTRTKNVSSTKLHQSKQKLEPNSILETTRQKGTFNDLSNIVKKGSQTGRNMKSAQHSWEGTALNLSQVNVLKSKFAKKKFQNIIILKGKTITKREVFDLREYFDSLSGGNKAILIQNFIESFNQDKYNHMKSVAASLFNFLDMDQNGKVTFKELIQKLYPDLTTEHYEIIKLWNTEYNQNFNLQKKIKANREHEQLKKRILPKTCLARYKQMFDFFDKDKKGWVDVKDLMRVLGDVSNQKEIVETFEENDRDKDGRLNLKEFMHVLLPVDLEIEGV